MNPSEVIQEAYTSIHEHNFEDHVPKFWNTATGHAEFGVRRRASKSVLSGIEAHMGVYPSVQVSVLKQSHGPVETAEQNALSRAYPEIIALSMDPYTSVSLWLVADDHVCASWFRTSRTVDRIEQQIEKTSEKEKENGGVHAAEHDSGDLDPSDSGAKPKAKSDPRAEPLRLDARSLFRNLAFQKVVRTSDGRDTKARVIRIAVDFKSPTGKSVRRTGTVVDVVTKVNHLGQSETNTGARYSYSSGDMVWSVAWDDPKWFGGAWAWLAFVDFESDSDGPSGASTHFRETDSGDLVEEGRREDPVLVLAWTCKASGPQQQPQEPPKPKPKPQPRPKGRVRGAANPAAHGDAAAAAAAKQPEPQPEPYPEWYTVTTVCKRQQEWKRVQLTRDERDALGLGRTRREVEREVKLSAKALNWVESWSDSRFRPVVRREE